MSISVDILLNLYILHSGWIALASLLECFDGRTRRRIMESWRKVWRDGFAPQLSTAGLDALRHALREDDTRLIQGVTTSPPPIPCLREWAVEGACAVAFCAWQGEGFDTVGEVEL